MARYDERWAPYVPVAERRRQAERMAARLRRKGQVLAPVRIAGRTIAATFWGKAWCDNLEAYSDYETRLPRGRTYLRNGSGIDLQIARGQVTALVSGSEVYRVALAIKEVSEVRWRSICTDCAGSIASVVELLRGRFAKGVRKRLCRQQNGLFPAPPEIRFSCSCPDHALMCRHVAAVLYGVGARLDDRPECYRGSRATSRQTRRREKAAAAKPRSKAEGWEPFARSRDPIKVSGHSGCLSGVYPCDTDPRDGEVRLIWGEMDILRR